MDAGEEVDLSTACQKETLALSKYMVKELNIYKNAHPSELSEKKQRYYTPKQPFFQYMWGVL